MVRTVLSLLLATAGSAAFAQIQQQVTQGGYGSMPPQVSQQNYGGGGGAGAGYAQMSVNPYTMPTSMPGGPVYNPQPGVREQPAFAGSSSNCVIDRNGNTRIVTNGATIVGPNDGRHNR